MGSNHSNIDKAVVNVPVEKPIIQINEFVWCRFHKMFILQANDIDSKEIIHTVYVPISLCLKKRNVIKRDKVYGAKKETTVRPHLYPLLEHCAYV